jgi:hypothetical protein
MIVPPEIAPVCPQPGDRPLFDIHLKDLLWFLLQRDHFSGNTGCIDLGFAEA